MHLSSLPNTIMKRTGDVQYSALFAAAGLYALQDDRPGNVSVSNHYGLIYRLLLYYVRYMQMYVYSILLSCRSSDCRLSDCRIELCACVAERNAAHFTRHRLRQPSKHAATTRTQVKRTGMPATILLVRLMSSVDILLMNLLATNVHAPFAHAEDLMVSLMSTIHGRFASSSTAKTHTEILHASWRTNRHFFSISSDWLSYLFLTVYSLSVFYSLITARCYAERGYATVSRLSVCLSVCLSVMLRYDFHTGWNTSKIISRPNSLRLLLGQTPTWAIWCNGNTPKL